MLLHLGFVCGCFCTMSELSNCDIDHLACKDKNIYYYLAVNRKSWPILVLNNVPDHYSYIKISFRLWLGSSV